MTVKLAWNEMSFLVDLDQSSKAMEAMQFLSNATVVDERFTGNAEERYVYVVNRDSAVSMTTTSNRVVSQAEWVEMEKTRLDRDEADKKALAEAQEAKRLADEAAVVEQAQADEEMQVDESVAETV